MDPALVATAVVAALVAGAFIGFLARGQIANQAIKSAQEKAGRIVAEARAQQKELILEAKDEKLRLQREAEDEARAKRAELATL
jgi:ribonuclease Y